VTRLRSLANLALIWGLRLTFPSHHASQPFSLPLQHLRLYEIHINFHKSCKYITTLGININGRLCLTASWAMDPPDESDGTSSHRGRATIHPPIFFPAPQTPSTNRSSGSSSSGTKRKRVAADDHSDVGTLPSRTRASSTSDFNNNTKVQVRDQYNNQCWHCSASPADVCHVIGSRDNTVSQSYIKLDGWESDFIVVSTGARRWANRFPREAKPPKCDRPLWHLS
jgi:hypothetical protein